MTSAVETAGLTRRFGRIEAVRGLDLAVPAGSIFALIGPNGAGKTTTIKMLMNLVRPTAGQARVLGVDSRRLGVAELQRIGYVSENQRLPLWMTPRALFDYCRAFYPAWDAALARKLQDDLELPVDRRLRTLSRGTRMKAALLASLAYRPALVVLDEPFTGLDPLVRDELIRALLELPDGRDFTVFISSHDVDEVERLADWVGFMAAGAMILAEPVGSLLARFRAVEAVLPPGEQAHEPPRHAAWIAQERAGHTVRFIDTAHSDADAAARIAAAFPGATVHASPMTLRDIFVALARTAAPAEVS
jgi:ABC-2 type transport system ATP-binding protein